MRYAWGGGGGGGGGGGNKPIFIHLATMLTFDWSDARL